MFLAECNFDSNDTTSNSSIWRNISLNVKTIVLRLRCHVTVYKTQTHERANGICDTTIGTEPNQDSKNLFAFKPRDIEKKNVYVIK